MPRNPSSPMRRSLRACRFFFFFASASARLSPFGRCIFKDMNRRTRICECSFRCRNIYKHLIVFHFQYFQIFLLGALRVVVFLGLFINMCFQVTPNVFFSGDAAGVAFRRKADSHAEACAMKLASYRASGPTVERVAACSRALPLVVS